MLSPLTFCCQLLAQKRDDSSEEESGLIVVHIHFEQSASYRSIYVLEHEISLLLCLKANVLLKCVAVLSETVNSGSKYMKQPHSRGKYLLA